VKCRKLEGLDPVLESLKSLENYTFDLSRENDVKMIKTLLASTTAAEVVDNTAVTGKAEGGIAVSFTGEGYHFLQL